MEQFIRHINNILLQGRGIHANASFLGCSTELYQLLRLRSILTPTYKTQTRTNIYTSIHVLPMEFYCPVTN